MLLLKESLSSEESFLLELAKHVALNTNEPLNSHPLHSNLDWARIQNLSLAQGMFPSFYKNYVTSNEGLFGENLLSQIKEKWKLLKSKNLAITAEATRLWQVFDTKKIKAIPYKGFELSNHLYGDENSRQFDDIDILIQPDEIETFSGVLKELGYTANKKFEGRKKKAYQFWECELDFVQKHTNITVELHWAVAPRYLSDRALLDRLWNGENIKEEKGKFPHIMDPEMFLLLLIHNGLKHHFDRLSNIMDMLVLWKKINRGPNSLLSKINASNLDKIFFQFKFLSINKLEIPESLFSSNESLSKTASVNSSQSKNLKDTRLLDKIQAGERSFYLCLWQWNMLENYKQKFIYAYKLLFVPNEYDWKKINLRDSFYLLYYVLRPLRLFYSWVLK